MKNKIHTHKYLDDGSMLVIKIVFLLIIPKSTTLQTGMDVCILNATTSNIQKRTHFWDKIRIMGTIFINTGR